MKTNLTIKDLSIEHHQLILTFADLLEKSTQLIPEITREQTGRYYTLHPEAKEKIGKIKAIIEGNEINVGSEKIELTRIDDDFIKSLRGIKND